MSAHPAPTQWDAAQHAAEQIAAYGKSGELERQLGEIWRRAGPAISAATRAEGERLEAKFMQAPGPGVSRVRQISAARGEAMDYAGLFERAVVVLLANPFNEATLAAIADHERAYLAADAPLSMMLSTIARVFAIATKAAVAACPDDADFTRLVIDGLGQALTVRLDIVSTVYHDAALAREAELRMTEAHAFRELVGGMLAEALAGSKALRSQSAQTSSSARGMLGKASEVAAAAEQSAVAMREAAQTAAGLIRAIEEARCEVELAAGVASRAGEESDRAVAVTAMLSEHAQAIESILRLIRDIAGQTNLLALNATIEAARAGDAGRGFAVVAQEVKSLASQTARATDDIAAKIGAIQVATRQTVDANGSIRGTIRDVQASAERIRGAMETQAQTVTMITAAVDETALAADVMSSTIGAIRQGTEQLAGTIDQLDFGFREVDQRLGALGSSAEDFTARLR